jgi:hypothetical protein
LSLARIFFEFLVILHKKMLHFIQNDMKKQTLKQIKSSIRKKQLKDGFFDGRFAPKTQANKKKVLNKKQCRLRIDME